MTLLHLVALCCRLALGVGLAPSASSRASTPVLAVISIDSCTTQEQENRPADQPGILASAAQVWPLSAVVTTAHSTLNDARSAWRAVIGPPTKQECAQCPLKVQNGERFLRRMCT